jgi:hypothetical protein
MMDDGNVTSVVLPMCFDELMWSDVKEERMKE